MTADAIGVSALGGYFAIAAGVIIWQAVRAPAGPMIWWLYVAERLVCGLMWRVRSLCAEGRPRRCPFPADSGALIVANHRSPADPIVLWQNHHLGTGTREIRPIHFLMAREFYNVRWLTWFYRAMRAIPVTRDGHDIAAVRTALAELKEGHWVGIFPEGGINHGPPGLKEANPGVAFLALNTQSPVYPVYIAGAPVGTSLVRSIFRMARTRLIYGDPIDLSPYRGQRKTPELLGEVTELIMNTIAELGGVKYLADSSPGNGVPKRSDRPERTPASPKENNHTTCRDVTRATR